MTGQRALWFVTVGAAGFVVQMSVAAALLSAGVGPLPATALAIEAAIVTNHAWHRRWVWRDRAAVRPWPQTLLRAHMGAGGSSLLTGVVTVGALASVVEPLVAQAIAVALAAGVNYWLADRWVFAAGRRTHSVAAGLVPRHRGLPDKSGSYATHRGLPDKSGSYATHRGLPDKSGSYGTNTAAALACLLLLVPGQANADGPSSQALASWSRYVAALDRSRSVEVTRGAAAWATDDDPRGDRVLAAIHRGTLEVTRRTVPGIDVRDATLAHWQGSALVRGATLAQVARRLRHPEEYRQPPDVVSLRVAGWSERGHELYLRLTRSLLVTATFDTWHRVWHREMSPTRVDSFAESTRVEEVYDPGTARERRVALSDSRGFLWRMRSHWRFVAVPEGVVVTCESVTLSRPVPTGLGLVASPVITRVARESMATAVRAWTGPRSGGG